MDLEGRGIVLSMKQNKALISRMELIYAFVFPYAKCRFSHDAAEIGQSCASSAYRKIPSFLEARKLCCNLPKIQTNRPNLKGILSKDANGKANSEDHDQTAPLGLFAPTYLSKNLGSLRYFILVFFLL